MKNIKGIYLAPGYDLSNIKKSKELNGIEKKIFAQIKTFQEYGYEIHYFSSFAKIDIDLIKNINFIYVRKSILANRTMFSFFRRVKNTNGDIKVILEIPTYPYDSELKIGWKLRIKDILFRNLLRMYVNRIVTYSEDKKIFGIKTINLVNAIDFEKVKRTDILNETSKDINIIAVSSLDFWHGYDRAIKGLHNFYKENSFPNFKLYIVGKGSEYNKYRELIKEYKLEKHVFMTGFKSGEDLKELYSSCVIGLDSMGRHRSGVYYNSSLKGKEYCAQGLMIVSGIKTELDHDHKYKYYFRVPADESPVEFRSIYEFYKRCLEKENIKQIQTNIMEYARTNYDYKVALRKIADFIEK